MVVLVFVLSIQSFKKKSLFVDSFLMALIIIIIKKM